MIDWPKFVEIVHAHQRFLLVCHVRPDCDALGSELAMAAILEHFGSPERFIAASRDEIEQVPGLPHRVAREIYGQLHKTG